jgi:hypothetical protein
MNSDKFNTLVEQRNDVDFEAYRLLQQMDEDGLLNKPALLAALTRDGGEVDDAEATEIVENIVTTFRDLTKKRRSLDQAIIAASLEAACPATE